MWDLIDIHTTIFGARLYDDRICRWTSQDPLAAKYPAFSPYAYCAGDPVNSIDLFGKKEWRINQKGEIVGEENNSQYDMFNYLKDLIPFELLFQ